MSSVTRKHFECIASKLRENRPHNPKDEYGYDLASEAVAQALQEFNPRFNRDKFLEASKAYLFNSDEFVI